jgi:hypothetical protein
VVYRQTVERAAATGLEVATLPSWYDIDTIADLERLHHDLRLHPVGVPNATLAVLNGMLRPMANIDGQVEENDA